MAVTQSTSFDSVELYIACSNKDDLVVQTKAYETLWLYLYQVALQMVYDQVESEALAQDCAQIALIRIHARISECKEPSAFRSWSRHIVRNLIIDELRRRKRHIPLDTDRVDDSVNHLIVDYQSSPETTTLQQMADEEIKIKIGKAPISGRSRRVVLGRYFDGISDELLAQTESELIGSQVLPSHIQVTRSKNIAKLKNWEGLQANRTS